MKRGSTKRQSKDKTADPNSATDKGSDISNSEDEYAYSESSDDS